MHMAAQSDAELFRALVRAAGCCVGVFHAQHLANTAWAFVTLGQFDVKLFTSVARVAAQQRLGDLNVQHVANTAWAFAMAGQPDAQLFVGLAKTAKRRMGDFDAQGFANTA